MVVDAVMIKSWYVSRRHRLDKGNIRLTSKKRIRMYNADEVDEKIKKIELDNFKMSSKLTRAIKDLIHLKDSLEDGLND